MTDSIQAGSQDFCDKRHFSSNPEYTIIPQFWRYYCYYYSDNQQRTFETQAFKKCTKTNFFETTVCLKKLEEMYEYQTYFKEKKTLISTQRENIEENKYYQYKTYWGKSLRSKKGAKYYHYEAKLVDLYKPEE